jgi:geranylgeranyl pyrophosphate synthase
LIGSADNLGKSPGLDFTLGEVTLPILNLIDHAADKDQIIALLGRPGKTEAFRELRQKFINSPALQQTKDDIQSYIGKARNSLHSLKESCFKESLLGLTDFLAERVSI